MIGILVRLEEEGNDSNFEVIQKFCTKVDKSDRITDLGIELKDIGHARIGVKTKRGLSKALNNFLSYRFTIKSPREAKCCQSWIDFLVDPENFNERFAFNKLNVIKRMHAILNGLKLLQCVICNCQTPGFDSQFHELQVLECGSKVSFVDRDIEKHLRQSKVLGVGVNLDFTFNG